MNRSKILIIIITFLIPCLSMRGNEIISEADSAYNAGNFARATELYEMVIQENGISAALLYNLGNSYLNLDDYGNAMLCYQKAKKLDPGNKLINSNLNYLSEKIEDANKAEQKGVRKKVDEDTPNFFQSIHTPIAKNTSSNAWAAWAAAFFILFSGCVCLYLYNSNVLMRKTGFFGGFILLGLSMICLVCAYMGAAEVDNHEYGIIMGYKTTLKTEPGSSQNNEKSEGVLTRGTKIRIVAEETDAEGNITWYKVRLNSDYTGWVESKEISVI